MNSLVRRIKILKDKKALFKKHTKRINIRKKSGYKGGFTHLLGKGQHGAEHMIGTKQSQGSYVTITKQYHEDKTTGRKRPEQIVEQRRL